MFTQDNILCVKVTFAKTIHNFQVTVDTVGVLLFSEFRNQKVNVT